MQDSRNRFGGMGGGKNKIKVSEDLLNCSAAATASAAAAAASTFLRQKIKMEALNWFWFVLFCGASVDESATSQVRKKTFYLRQFVFPRKRNKREKRRKVAFFKS